MIKEQNDHIAKLNAKIDEHELENKNLNLLEACFIMGDALALRMALASNKGTKATPNLMLPRNYLILLRVRLPWFRIEKVTFYILRTILSTKLKKIRARKPHTVSHHAYLYSNEASSSRHSTHIKMPKKKIMNASNEHDISFKTFDASYVPTNKSGKIVAKYVGGKHKSPKTCVWVPKVLVSNVKDPRPFGYLRTMPKFVLLVYASGGSSWIIDSGCINHMTGEKRMFSSYEKNEDPQRAITFGDGNQGLGKTAISPDHSISNVFLVDSLDYNLLSVSQLCKMGYNCLFTDVGVTVFRRSDDSIAFKGVLDGQLYLLVDFNDNHAELDTCLITKTNMGWLWHRRLAHVGMKNLHKLLKGEHIL
jgi:hypothetical protein